jgi:hypothetical protein
MQSPLGPVLERISRGLTLQQKIVFTILGVLWVVSPFDFDFIPLLGWIDDLFVINALVRVWKSPTLAAPDVAGKLFRSLGGVVASYIRDNAAPHGGTHKEPRR